jgi:hypothetical protein
MSKDRFDEYFLTLTQAKNHEKLGRDAQALEVFLEIIKTYSPDTDYAYERAVILLEKKLNYSKAKEICIQAIEKIKKGDLTGDLDFYESRLNRIDEKLSALVPKAQSKLPEYLKNHTFIALSLGYMAIALILSLPNKFSKFFFLVFAAISFLLIIEIFKNIKKKLTVKWQSLLLLAFLVATMGAASLIPPPEWTQFLSVGTFTTSTPLTSAPPSTSIPGSTEMNDDDLSILRNLLDSSYIIADYELYYSDRTMDLIVYLTPAASTDAAKEAIVALLKELNAIKGFEPGLNDRLGDLYKHYSVSITGYTSFGERIINAQVFRASQKIGWR